jgi:hypothetical protein
VLLDIPGRASRSSRAMSSSSAPATGATGPTPVATWPDQGWTPARHGGWPSGGCWPSAPTTLPGT